MAIRKESRFCSLVEEAASVFLAAFSPNVGSDELAPVAKFAVFSV